MTPFQDFLFCFAVCSLPQFQLAVMNFLFDTWQVGTDTTNLTDFYLFLFSSGVISIFKCESGLEVKFF